MDNPYWHPDEKGHIVNCDDVRMIVFEIFNIVRASQSMIGTGEPADEDEDRDPGPTEQLHYQYAEIRLSKLLLQLAVNVRTIDDYWSDYGHEDYLAKIEALNKEASLGSLSVAEKTTDLNLREALNKIIHARDVRPVYDSEDERDDPHARWGMDGQLELTGTYQKKEWSAVVNIMQLLDGVVELIDLVDELYT